MYGTRQIKLGNHANTRNSRTKAMHFLGFFSVHVPKIIGLSLYTFEYNSRVCLNCEVHRLQRGAPSTFIFSRFYCLGSMHELRPTIVVLDTCRTGESGGGGAQ